MKDNFNHTDFERDFFKKTKIRYSKSKEVVWSELDAKLNETKQTKVIKVNFRKVISYSAAAVLIVGLGILSFLRYYSVNVYCPNGQHSAVTLPDGSKVTLNANSQLAYHPYWWKYSRKLDFSGEAFFEVTKGDKFSVVSENGTTSVLGTSFNIFARNNEYRVHCITGKVKVEKKNKESVILSKNEYTVIDKNQKLGKAQDEVINQNSISWVKNKFTFTKAPIKVVLEEIERQYDVTIEGKEDLDITSVFTFIRGSSLDSVLNENIGKPYGIMFKPISKSRYKVVK
jgi:transmembrane sensor